MTIDAVKNYTRVMAPVFTDLESIPVFTLFQTLFTSGETIIEPDASVIDIDIQRGNKKLAAYIARGTDAINVAEKRSLLEKFTSDSKEYPLIEEITPITSVMIGKRMPGESVYNPLSKMQKQMALAMKAHREDMKRIIRKMEASAAESFRTGAQTVHGGNAYDFYRRATHNANAATVWSDSANAKPITDLDTAGQLIFRDGNRRPTDVIMSDQSWDEFLKTTQVKDLADSRRIIHFVADMNMDAPAGYDAWVNAGAIFQGQVKAGSWKYNLWTYPAIYETDGGTQTQYLPDEEVLVMANGSRYDRYFGPNDRLEIANDTFFREMFGIGDFEGTPPEVQNAGIFSSNMFHMDAYGVDNNKAFNVRTQVAPIFPTTETDTIVKIAT
jgi:hypothetical protein